MSDPVVIQASLLTRSETIHFVPIREYKLTLTTVLFISFFISLFRVYFTAATYPFRAVSSVTLPIKENCGMSLY